MENDDCAICLSTITHRKVKTECGHYFHFDCIAKAFGHSDSCPLCWAKTKIILSVKVCRQPCGSSDYYFHRSFLQRKGCQKCDELFAKERKMGSVIIPMKIIDLYFDDTNGNIRLRTAEEHLLSWGRGATLPTDIFIVDKNDMLGHVFTDRATEGSPHCWYDLAIDNNPRIIFEK